MHRINGRRILAALAALIGLATFAPAPVYGADCRISYAKCMVASKKPTSPIHASELECMASFVGCVARAIIQR